MDDPLLTMMARKIKLRSLEDPHELSWTKVFFHGTGQLLHCQRQWIQDLQKNYRRFRFKKLLLIKALNEPPFECPIQVWEMRTETGRYAVKLFDEYTDEDARNQLSRIPDSYLPPSRPSLDQVKGDADPFLLELRAQEQIDRFCPELQKHFFPKYHGAIELPTRAFPYGSIYRRRGIVMDLLQPGPSSWTLFPADIPEFLWQDLEIVDQELTAMVLPDLEKKWYRFLFLDRGRRVAALNALGISHGDIKHDCFGLSENFHDIALFDFSIAYTFTPQRPCLTNGTPKLRTLKRALWVDLSNTRYVTLMMAKQRKFRNHIAELFGLSLQETDTLLNKPPESYEENLEMIILHRRLHSDTNLESGSIFPSLSSIFPFLEVASPSKSGAWLVKTAQLLGKYVAIWLRHDEAQESRNITASVISSEGLELDRFDLLVDVETGTPEETGAASGGKEKNGNGKPINSLLMLVPEFWNPAATWEQLCRWTISSVANNAHRDLWTATRREIGHC